MEAIPLISAYHCPVFHPKAFQKFCNTNMLTSIFSYVLSHDSVNETNRNQFFSSYIGMLIIYYVELKFFWPFIIFRKNNASVIVKK